MATVMLMHWREATPEQYDQVRDRVRWDEDVPAGVKLHICGFADDGMRILDVWDSEHAFNTFFEQRIGPAVQEVGIEGQPDVKFYETHGVFAPALGKNDQTAEV
jgi:hypothetical protein